MGNRDILLNVQFPPAVSTELVLELDLRDIYTNVLIGRRGQLQFMTKLVFKGGDEYRKDQSVFRLWADVRVQGDDGVPASIGRAVIPEPVFFGPPSADSFASVQHDPWTRAIDRLTLSIDHEQLDDIERRRKGGSLNFTLVIGGTVQHGGKVGLLYASNNQLTYDVSASDWTKLLGQLTYGTYMTIEVPLTSPNGLTGAVQQAAQALQEAQAAFQRGDYEEAVADCRPGIEALEKADKGEFSLKPWDRAAGKEERFYWVQRSLLSITHIAHHPNDPAIEAAEGGRPRWGREDAEAVMAMLGAMIRWRVS